MKLLHFSIITTISIFVLFMNLPYQADGSYSGLPSSYPENMTMKLSFIYDHLNPANNNNAIGVIHLRFFNAVTNSSIAPVMYSFIVTERNQTLLKEQLETFSGNVDLYFINGTDTEWKVLVEEDPMNIGGYSWNPFHIKVQIPPTNDVYHFKIEPVVSYENYHSLNFTSSGIKYNVDLNFRQDYKTIVNSVITPEFPATSIVLLIAISLTVFYGMKIKRAELSS